MLSFGTSKRSTDLTSEFITFKFDIIHTVMFLQFNIIYTVHFLIVIMSSNEHTQ
jgi:hypothetical protein